MENTLKQIDLLKRKAKILERSEPDKALATLQKAVALAEAEIGHLSDTDDRRIALYRHLADAYGMRGGIYRRQNDLTKSTEMYSVGLKYEKRVKDNSYNLSNKVVNTILQNPEKFDDEGLRDDIRYGVEAVQEQIRGPRKDDFWAWSDLGLFALLHGDRKAAREAYRFFKASGPDPNSFRSTVRVLEQLREALSKTRFVEVTESLDEIIDLLRGSM